MREYTLAGVVAVVAVVLLERHRWRSGVFRNRSYWIAMAICLFFMVLVNGWLTKLSAPIVQYAPSARTPWRFPWDIPVEDYLFGFALLTAVVARWEVRADHAPDPVAPDQLDRTSQLDRLGRSDSTARPVAPEGAEPCPPHQPSLSPSSPSS